MEEGGLGGQVDDQSNLTGRLISLARGCMVRIALFDGVLRTSVGWDCGPGPLTVTKRP